MTRERAWVTLAEALLASSDDTAERSGILADNDWRARFGRGTLEEVFLDVARGTGDEATA